MCVHVCAKSLQLCPTLCNPMDCNHQAPLSTVFSRQKYWSGLPCPPSGDLPDPGIEPRSPGQQADSLPLSHQGSPKLGYPQINWDSCSPSCRASFNYCFPPHHGLYFPVFFACLVIFLLDARQRGFYFIGC